MIDWLSFLLVLAASIAGACGVVVLFALGLRFAGPETRPGPRRVVGVVFFVLCGLLIALGVALVLPQFAPFFASL